MALFLCFLNVMTVYIDYRDYYNEFDVFALLFFLLLGPMWWISAMTFTGRFWLGANRVSSALLVTKWQQHHSFCIGWIAVDFVIMFTAAFAPHLFHEEFGMNATIVVLMVAIILYAGRVIHNGFKFNSSRPRDPISPRNLNGNGSDAHRRASGVKND